MKTAIDKAGRVVIPAAIRSKAGLSPGTQLEVSMDSEGVRLVPLVPRPKLVQRNGRMVAVPTAPDRDLPSVDVAAMVEEERDRWPL